MIQQIVMVGFEDALKIIEREAFLLSSVKARLEDSLGCVLAETVVSDTDMPPFNKSAMDGFACRRGDLQDRLEIIETIRAGDIPEKVVGRNQCSKIMTGARVPDGADCVVMVEHVENEGANHIRFTADDTAVNIAFMGEDLKKGDTALEKGTMIGPQHIAVLASAGCTEPLVFSGPRVAVLVSGDEIVEPGIKPSGTSIRNSNGPQLVAQVKRTGAVPWYMGVVKDDRADTSKLVNAAIENCDILLITGGVSMGDYDFVPGVLKDSGVRLFFEKVAVKPGRPTVFGRKGDVFVFGLPGNPVSSFIIFELFVKTLILRMMGHFSSGHVLRFPIAADYSRKRADRVSWAPIALNGSGEAVPLDYHGSAHIHALTDAWGLLCMPAGVHSFKKGDFVDVRQI